MSQLTVLVGRGGWRIVEMASPHQKERTRRMQFGPSVPPGVGANSIPRGEIVIAAEGVEWSIKDPPLLTSLRIKWWGQEGEGTTSRIHAKVGSNLLTSATNLVFPAMCGPKNLSLYFHDMRNMVVEILDGSGPARVVGKADIDISDLVRDGSISGKYPIMAGQKTVGLLPLSLSVNFFPTVVTSFELNEHQAEADTMTPVLPTPGFTTWRAAAGSRAKTGVGTTTGSAAAERGQPEPAVSAPAEAVSKLEGPEEDSGEPEQGFGAGGSVVIKPIGGGGGLGVDAEAPRMHTGEGGADVIRSGDQGEGELHAGLADGGGADPSVGASVPEAAESGQTPVAPELAPAVPLSQGGTEPLKERSRLDADLEVLIARAEKLREEMARACETNPLPVSNAAARLARLELPLIERGEAPSPEAGRREKRPRSSSRHILDVLGQDEGLVIRYGAPRRRGRSVLSPRHFSEDSSDGSGGETDSSDVSGASESWAGPDSEDDAHGVAEDELLKELFFAENWGRRRREVDESSDLGAPEAETAEESQSVGKLGFALSPERISAVRIAVGNLMLAGAPIGPSRVPPSCSLSMRFPVVPPAMADIAAAHPPQAMSIVSVRSDSRGFVFRHSADFPLRMADPDVRQLWQFGELRIEARVGRVGVSRGSLLLDEVLGSMSGPYRISVALYREASERKEVFSEQGPEARIERPGVAASKGDSEADGLHSGGVDQQRGTGEGKDEGSDWRPDGAALFGTLDLEVHLLSSGRGRAHRTAEDSIAETLAENGSQNGERPPCLFVQVSGVQLSTGLAESGGLEGEEIVLIAKAPRPGGGDDELRAPGCSRGFGRWRVSSRQREGFVPAPKELAASAIARQDGTLVVEVWRRRHSADVSRSRAADVSGGRKADVSDVQDALLGLVRVPLRRGERPPRLRGLEGLIQEQVSEIWDPLTSTKRGTVKLSVWLGSDVQVRQVARECAAAVRIQRHARGFAARKRVAALVADRLREKLGMGRGACVRHTFWVTVVGAAGLPAGGALYDVSGVQHGREIDSSQSAKQSTKRSGTAAHKRRAVTFQGDLQPSTAHSQTPVSSPPKQRKPANQTSLNQLETQKTPPQGYRFIKYWFPREPEPLYTRNVDWNGSPQFGAQATHSITLPVAECIGDHLGAVSQGLRFEVWDRVDTWQGGSGEKDGEECQVGVAEMRTAVLVEAAGAQGTAAGREFKKTFELPIRLADGVPPGEGFPRLRIELSYQASAVFHHPLADTVFAPRGQPLPELPIEAILDIKIIRASGLQAAVAAAIPTSPSLRTVLHSGAHSYVRLSLFPSSHELELQYPPIHTPLQAQTFTPHYGFHRRLSVTLTEEVVRAFRTGEMVLEVWHHAPRSLLTEGTNSWLGTASVALSQLLRSEKGINGWYDIHSRRGDTVGAIELAVAIVEWRPLVHANGDDVIVTSPEPLSPPAPGPSRTLDAAALETSSTFSGRFTRGRTVAQKGEELITRLTVSVEEATLSREGGKDGGLRELLHGKRPPLERYYAVHTRYGEAEPCVSRAVQAREKAPPSESNPGGTTDRGDMVIPLEHTCESEAPFDAAFLEYLEQRLAVEIWRVETGRDPPRKGAVERERKRDRLVGTAYVSLSPLLDHGVADLGISGGWRTRAVGGGVSVSTGSGKEAPKAASLSGSFALLHPDAANLGESKVRVRVLLQLGARQNAESLPSGSSETANMGGLERRLHESQDELPMGTPVGEDLEEGGPGVMLGMDSGISVTSEADSDEGSAADPFQREPKPEATLRLVSVERGSEGSDDVDDEDWLQQRALRRSAELLRRSKEAGGWPQKFADSGLESDGERAGERDTSGYRGEETLLHSPARVLSPVRDETVGQSTAAGSEEGSGQFASRADSRVGGDEPGVLAGRGKRVAGHVTVTAPPNRERASGAGAPTLSFRADKREGIGLGRLGGPSRSSAVAPAVDAGSLPPVRSPERFPDAFNRAPPERHSMPSATQEGAHSAPQPRGSLQTLPEQRYTSVRVCIEAAINLEYTASNSQAEEDFWAGAETSKTQNPKPSENPTPGGEELARSSIPPLQNVPQGLFVSYRWQETGGVVCSPLVGLSASPKWYHTRHLPLAVPTGNRPPERVLVLKVWERLAQPGTENLTHVGGVNAPPLQLGARLRAQEATPAPDLDRLIGCAAIDLSPLFLGMEELCGWYTVHDLRQRSLGQLKVVVSPVDVILSNHWQPAESEGRAIRPRSPPQRGPPAAVSPLEGGNSAPGTANRETDPGFFDLHVESGARETTVESEPGAPVREDGFGEKGCARESSMEDVRLRLEELQEMSRKMLERGGLAQGGDRVPGREAPGSDCEAGDSDCESGSGLQGPQAGVGEPGLDRASVDEPSVRQTAEEAESRRAKVPDSEGALVQGETGQRDESGGVTRAAWQESSSGLTPGGRLAGEHSGHFLAQVEVYAGVERLPEEADGVECEMDDLEGGQGGNGWTEESSKVAVPLEKGEGADGNDDWAQTGPMEEAPLKKRSPVEGFSGGEDSFRETGVNVSEEEGLLVEGPEREEATDSLIATKDKLQPVSFLAAAGGADVSLTSIGDACGGPSSGVGQTSQRQSGSSDSHKADAETAPPQPGYSGSKEAAKPPKEAKPLPRSVVFEERSAFEERHQFEYRSASSKQLPPRPPNRVGGATRHPFTVHSSITFAPAPLKSSRPSTSSWAPGWPLEGRLSPLLLRPDRGAASRTSREEEVEGFRGFSRQVEAVVSAAAASGPVWPRTRMTYDTPSEHTRESNDNQMRLVARAEVTGSDGEGRPAKAARKKYADKETERIARIMGMQSL